MQDQERDLRSRLAAVAAREAAIEAREARATAAAEAAATRIEAAEERARSCAATARAVAATELAEAHAAVCSEQQALKTERVHILAARDEAAATLARCNERNAEAEDLRTAKAAAEVAAQDAAAEAGALRAQMERLLNGVAQLRHDLGSESIVATAIRPLSALQREEVWLAELGREVEAAVRGRAVAAAAAAAATERASTADRTSANAAATAAAAETRLVAVTAALRESQALLAEADHGRERALAQAEDCRLALRHAERELRAVEAATAARATASRGMPLRSRTTSPAPSGSHVPINSAVATLRAVRSSSAGASLPPLSTATVLPGGSNAASSGSAAAVTARLEHLEMEEAELQDEFRAYRERLALRQTAIHDGLRHMLQDPAKPPFSQFRPLVSTGPRSLASVSEPSTASIDAVSVVAAPTDAPAIGHGKGCVNAGKSLHRNIICAMALSPCSPTPTESCLATTATHELTTSTMPILDGPTPHACTITARPPDILLTGFAKQPVLGPAQSVTHSSKGPPPLVSRGQTLNAIATRPLPDDAMGMAMLSSKMAKCAPATEDKIPVIEGSDVTDTITSIGLHALPCGEHSPSSRGAAWVQALVRTQELIETDSAISSAVAVLNAGLVSWNREDKHEEHTCSGRRKNAPSVARCATDVETLKCAHEDVIGADSRANCAACVAGDSRCAPDEAHDCKQEECGAVQGIATIKQAFPVHDQINTVSDNGGNADEVVAEAASTCPLQCTQANPIAQPRLDETESTLETMVQHTMLQQLKPPSDLASMEQLAAASNPVEEEMASQQLRSAAGVAKAGAGRVSVMAKQGECVSIEMEAVARSCSTHSQHVQDVGLLTTPASPATGTLARADVGGGPMHAAYRIDTKVTSLSSDVHDCSTNPKPHDLIERVDSSLETGTEGFPAVTRADAWLAVISTTSEPKQKVQPLTSGEQHTICTGAGVVSTVGARESLLHAGGLDAVSGELTATPAAAASAAVDSKPTLQDADTEAFREDAAQCRIAEPFAYAHSGCVSKDVGIRVPREPSEVLCAAEPAHPTCSNIELPSSRDPSCAPLSQGPLHPDRGDLMQGPAARSVCSTVGETAESKDVELGLTDVDVLQLDLELAALATDHGRCANDVASTSDTSNEGELTAEELLSTLQLPTPGVQGAGNSYRGKNLDETGTQLGDVAAGVELGMLELERLEAHVARTSEEGRWGARVVPVDTALAAEEAELEGLDLNMLAGLEELESLSSLGGA
jgi:hypothetical protein